MLVEFSIGNFWSFKEVQTFQMQAAKIVSKNKKLDENNVIPVNDKRSLLKSKAVFGANASGKSNLVRAFFAMLEIVEKCLSDQEILRHQIISFYLDEETESAPSFFQMVFILDEIEFRYGFQANKEKFFSEWLFGRPINAAGKVRERKYFTREGMEVEINETLFKEGKTFIHTPTRLYRENSLLLSVVAAFNGLLAKKIVDYLNFNFGIISGIRDVGMETVLNYLHDPGFKDKLNSFIKGVDPTIQKIEQIELDLNNLIANDEYKSSIQHYMKQTGKKPGSIVVFRKKNGEKGESVPILLPTQEAEGTKKLVALSPSLFQALEKGSTLIIDEFDARLHPKLSRKIVELFHSKRTNPNNAQLIFITHDSNFLDAKLLRRDQIAFVQKHREGYTSLFSLVEFKGIRNDASFEKDYLSGKYDAIPNNLNALEEMFQ